ncbi:hypothetical protein PVK06_043588 [Gossypium arboreum]|uniref:Uncharacterized protein n=1 Tax=Gossypium arboreum TaxID=29729 RepID=A0ABR0MRF1_GOSAR|nr:hypothetical protein PVK06_043588 [Gossypium arboreum]
MDANKINELYNTKVDVDEHSKLIEDITDNKRDLLIDSLVKGDFIVGQEAPAIEEEVAVEEEDVRVEVVNKKAKEENTEIEATETESVEDIVNASEFVCTTTDNLE